MRALLFLAALLLGMEVMLRLSLTLGDPVLVERDPFVEYRMVPNRDYRRWGNRIAINAHGLRGPSFPARAEERDRRVLLIGDSVVYGNHFLDQTETIPARLTARMRADPGHSDCRPLAIPAAASSWGPVNQAAFLAETGLFGAGEVLAVVSAHDLYDTPDHGPVAPYRLAPPIGALHDLALIAAVRLWPAPADPMPPIALRKAQSLLALDRLVDMATGAGATFRLVYHPTIPERQDAPHPARASFGAWATARGVRFMDLGRTPLTQDHYRDAIHPNATGAARIAEALFAALPPPRCTAPAPGADR